MKYNKMEKSRYVVCNKDKQCFVKLGCENKRRGKGERERERETSVSTVSKYIFLLYNKILFTAKCPINIF